MTLLHVVILAIVQGLAELLPVSSSAHVVVAEKLMGLDPTSPEMTLLLVMLHTGTMFAVIVYFWKQWRKTYFQSAEAFKRIAILLIVGHGADRSDRRGLDQSNREIRFSRRGERGGGTALRAARSDRARTRRRRHVDFDRRHLRKAAPLRGVERHRRPGNETRRTDRNRAGTLPALPRLLALWRDDFDRASCGRGEIARRSFQLCSGRCCSLPRRTAAKCSAS